MKKNTVALIGNYNYYQRSPAWKKALEELNFTVEKIDEPLSNRNSKKFYFRIQQHFLMGPTFWQEKAIAINHIIKSKADINIFHKSLAFDDADIAKIKKLTGAHNVLYNNDNIFGPLASEAYWRRMRSAIQEFDLILAYRQSCVENYKKCGAKKVYLLKSYYLPWLHYSDASCEKIYDVTFIGHYEDDGRSDYMASLIRSCNANYLLKGAGWDKVKGNIPWALWNTDPIFGDAYANALRQSKIALAFFSTLNQDLYTRRVFEIPACGAMLMSPRTDVMVNLYKEDEEAVFFESKEELIDKIKFYLTNDGIRSQIANKGLERAVKSGYDIYSRMREWMAFVE